MYIKKYDYLVDNDDGFTKFSPQLECSLILDERLLDMKEKEENRTDELMNALMEHPLVKEAIKEAVKDLLTQGKISNNWEA